MKEDHTPAKVKEWADSFIYVSLALGAVLGVNFTPYFEAKRDIAIEQAKAKSKIEILKMELELEKIKRQPINTSPEIYGRMDELESSMKYVLSMAHPKGDQNAGKTETRRQSQD